MIEPPGVSVCPETTKPMPPVGSPLAVIVCPFMAMDVIGAGETVEVCLLDTRTVLPVASVVRESIVADGPELRVITPPGVSVCPSMTKPVPPEGRDVALIVLPSIVRGSILDVGAAILEETPFETMKV